MLSMTQTPEERERLLDLSNGFVFCIDMQTPEGQVAIEDLAQFSEDVRTALTLFGDKAADGFLLAIHIAESDRMIVGISARIHIKHSMEMFRDQALKFSNTFLFVIIPPDQTIGAIAAEFVSTEGSA